MTVELKFTSYLRRGLTRLIGDSADASGIPQTDAGSINVNLESGGATVQRRFNLLGPAAVTGLVSGEVLRVVPPPSTDDHPPNLFPRVELKTPDLPWRYTPAQAHRTKSAETLMPWLVLAVVPERAGIALRSGVPLSVLSVDDASELPDLSDAWAWAHVQLASQEDDIDKVLLDAPESVWARLMCPRYLTVDTSYLACVVPSFEAGRLAGLGLSSAAAVASELAWTATSTAIELPVYHYWRFHTAAQSADFEELVRRLTPVPLTADVGKHALDVSDPGSDRLPKASVTLDFMGALLSPELKPASWPKKHRDAYRSGMAEFFTQLTLPESPIPADKYDPLLHDPVVAPSAYGLLPAGVETIPAPQTRPSQQAPRWLSECNFDPRHRAVAGVGSETVRRNQERLMASAWDQAAGIKAVNRVLVQTRLALESGRCLHKRLSTVSKASILQVSAPAHARLSASNGTVYAEVHSSDIPKGSVSGAFRRQLRPGGMLAKSLRSPLKDTSTMFEDTEVDVQRRVTDRIAAHTNSVVRYADLTVPFGTVFDDGSVAASNGPVIQDNIPGGLPGSVIDGINDAQRAAVQDLQIQLRRSGSRSARRLLQRLNTVLELDKLNSAPAATTPAAAVVASGTSLASGADRTTSASTARLVPQVITVEDAVTFSVNVVAAIDKQFDSHVVDSVFGPIDHVLSDAGTVSTTVTPIDLDALAATIGVQLEPTEVLASRLRHIISPPDILGIEPVPESVVPAMSINAPLYRDLVRINPELLMPGVGSLAADSVGLAAVNASFVEACLLGCNHELARELLWREFPAQLTDTWMRTFWDHASATGQSEVDIEAIADWRPRALGTHAAAGSDPAQMLVLVIKSDLLKRYPGTLISAVPARWDQSLREEDSDADILNPVFTGAIGSDVSFVGFQFPDTVDIDLDVRGSGNVNDAMPGWYFTFEQPATEPGFGLDTPASDTSNSLRFWKDLTWDDARLSSESQYVQLDALSRSLNLPYDENGANQWQEVWASSASAMARITLQRPVRMLVHADQMLMMPSTGTPS